MAGKKQREMDLFVLYLNSIDLQFKKIDYIKIFSVSYCTPKIDYQNFFENVWTIFYQDQCPFE